MYIDGNTITEFAKIITAILTIGGVFFGILKWFDKQKKTSEKVTELEEKEETDIEKIKKIHNEDMQSMQNELCVVSYGLLAALDGLKQLGCNGEVAKAYEKLSKHLNQQAHDQL